MDQHDSYCSTWDWVNGECTLNNAKACTCGLRSRQEAERAEGLARYRPLKPLGMSEDDWLRTFGIEP